MGDVSMAMNRFGLGLRQGEAVPADPRRWLLDQFARYDPRPAAIAAVPDSAAQVIRLRASREAQQDYKAEAERLKNTPEANSLSKPFRGIRDDYVAGSGARTNAALTTSTPFVERLVHFWSNHFAVSVDKLVTLGLAAPFEFEAIRPHVLGSFSDMLVAVTRHPGMLLYLDQAQSIGPESTLGTRTSRRGNQRGLNENLAREILELHTLGVRTGYTQDDVTELARALTGWTVGGLARQPQLRGPGPGFFFLDAIHQPGNRTVLGKRYEASGEDQARRILLDLAAHPATARHLATKLARHFAGDVPPPTLIARLEKTYLSSGGDLAAVYRALVEAPEPWSAPAKFRNPWDWTIATLRAVGVPAVPAKANAAAFKQLGQPIWQPGSPAGWDDTSPSWAGPDALFRRIEVAQQIAGRNPEMDARAMAERLFPGALSDSTRKVLAGAESPTQALALLLAAPEMLRR
ncbi:DUF1800 domain-containing protein [Novosphingobium sp.]|uniref:DUF1800 domain-containing protein n=1 Tax=Novosphingobium sp. TaxID=1874826 RepID=UPI0025F1A4CF|nr:DUF1800 domain-containing protein [Novosphingobium sp.]